MINQRGMLGLLLLLVIFGIGYIVYSSRSTDPISASKIVFRSKLQRTVSVTVYDVDNASTELTIKPTQIACAMSPVRIVKAHFYVPGVVNQDIDLTTILSPDGNECVDITWDKEIHLEPVFQICPSVQCQWIQPPREKK